MNLIQKTGAPFQAQRAAVPRTPPFPFLLLLMFGLFSSCVREPECGVEESALLGSPTPRASKFCFSSCLYRQLLCKHLVLLSAGQRYWALIFPFFLQLAAGESMASITGLLCSTWNSASSPVAPITREMLERVQRAGAALL